MQVRWLTISLPISAISVLVACGGQVPVAGLEPSRDSGQHAPSGDSGQDEDGLGPTTLDAAADGGDGSTPAGLATFAFALDSIVQTPLNCPSDNWEFYPVDATGQHWCSECPTGDAGDALRHAVITNTGAVQIAFVVEAGWGFGGHYVPGVATGAPNELVGVLDPGGLIDITSAWTGNVIALLGSSSPFSPQDAGRYLSDEGVIPWPAGVRESGGITHMYLAEIEAQTRCDIAQQVW